MKHKGNILFNTIQIVYLVIVFAVACLCFSRYLNQGNVDLTTEMSDASLPVVHINIGGHGVNYLYGYTEPMECAYMRDSLTVVDSDRRIDYSIDTYGTEISDICFEVRSIDGSRLVESTDLNIYSQVGDQINGKFTIKDLITNGNEYMLIFVIETRDGREIRYYSRLLWSEDMHTQEKIEFIYDFTTKTFNREEASELTKYLESNSSGDNSSFQHANIHSSFKQVTWGNLNVKRLCEPRITVSELTSATGYFRVDYQVEIQEESSMATCNVTEYFRIRYTSERVYLINWERYCNQIPDEKGNIYTGDQIELGIAPSDIQIKECDGGGIFAFVDEGKLIGVDAEEKKIALLYSVYGNDNNLTDIRNNNRESVINILNVDETGSVTFMVYGYMNRGEHEGRVGITVYNYNSAMNTIEELAYVDYTKSASILMDNVKELSYLDRDGNVYFMLERNVYEVDTESRTLTVVASSLADDSYKVSASGRLLVLQGDGDSIYNCTKLRLMNLSSGISEDIKGGYGDYILPLGFMNDDLVYGLARTKEVKQDIDGSMIFPMYSVVIRNSDGEILKEYSQPDTYIMSCSFSDDLINMKRANYNSSSDSYVPITDDQIVSTIENSGQDNYIVPVVTESLETIMQVSMKNVIADENRIYLTPREIIYEGSRELLRPESDALKRYYVYGLYGYMDSFLEVGNAVNEAYNNAGIVMDDSGQYVWYKSNRSGKNQIMAITEPEQVSSEDSVATCVDALLRLEGVTTNSRILLSQGSTVLDILEEYLSDCTILNLAGCNLDAVLYYVHQDIPVLAIMKDQTAVLITGYNDKEIVIFDPVKGELYKETITDMDAEFKSNGYKFITYIR